MMLKLGIFVEGQTELIFLEKFFKEYLGYHKVSIESFKLYGKKFIQIRGKTIMSESLLYVQIFNAGNDEKAISALKERCENMVNNGFHYLFVLRDVFPNKRTEIPIIHTYFDKLFKNSSCKEIVRLILAIMEIESWFLADYNVFSRISPFLSPEYINERIGINLIEQNPEQLDHPSKTINEIFKIIGFRYSKHSDQVYKIVNSLDYAFLLYSAEDLNKITSFFNFKNCIDECLTFD